MTFQLEPWEFDLVSSALALYAEQGDDMGDLERDEVRALRDRLEAQLDAVDRS
jgi:hypothetical protein